MLDIGLLIVRVVIGLLLFGHGTRKLFGWFGGAGIDAQRETLRSLGFRASRPLAWAHGLAEAGAGLLIAVGLLLPVAAAAVVAVMVNAALVVHRRNGLWIDRGGVEYPVVLGVVVSALSLTGAGRHAVATLLGLHLEPVWAVVGILTGLLAGVAVLTFAREPVPVGSSSSPAGGADEQLRAA